MQDFVAEARHMYARRLAAVEQLTERLATAATPQEAAAARALVREMESELHEMDASVVDLARYAAVTAARR